MKKDNSTGKSMDFYDKGQAIFDRITANAQLSKTILDPKRAWPFKPPTPPRPQTKKEFSLLLNTLPKAPF